METQAEYKPTTLTFLVKKFYEFHTKEKSFKAQMEDARTLKESWEEALLAKMLEEEVQNIKTTDGMFYSREDLYASYNKEREDETFAWLRDTGNDTLIRETINSKTLAAWVREQQEMSTELPDFFTVTIKRRIGVRSK